MGPCFGAGTGPLSAPILADDASAGEHWQAHWREDLGASLVTRKQAVAQGIARWFSGQRQVVESGKDRLHGLFAVNRPRSKGLLG